jgi:hypothetical protein
MAVEVAFGLGTRFCCGVVAGLYVRVATDLCLVCGGREWWDQDGSSLDRSGTHDCLV